MNGIKRTFANVVHSRNFSPTVITALVIAAFLIANALIYMVYAYTRSTATTVEKEDLSISDSAKEVLGAAKEAGKKITVTFCMSESDIQRNAEGSFIYRTAKYFDEKYSADDDFINLRFANIYTFEYEDTSLSDANRERFDPSKYQKVVRRDENYEIIKDEEGKEVADEYTVNAYTVIFECDSYGLAGDVVRTNTRVVDGAMYFQDFFTLDSNKYVTSYNGEEYFTAMLYWVIADKHDVAYFTTGHGEIPSTHLYNTLVCAGYYVDELNLRKEKVPENAALVVISNPKTDFEYSSNPDYVSEIDRLTDYADRGGNFLLILDPMAKSRPRLEQFAKDEFGLGFKTSAEGERLMVKDLNNSISIAGFTGFTLVAEYADSELSGTISDKLNKYGESIVVNDTGAVECNETLGAKPLLVSSPSSGLDAGGEDMGEAGPHAVVAYSSRAAENDNPSAKMVFIPSIYMTASDVMVSNSYANKDFLYAIYDGFYGAEDVPFGIDCVAMQEERLEDITFGTSMLYTSMLMAIPAVIAVIGTATILRRKNR